VDLVADRAESFDQPVAFALEVGDVDREAVDCDTLATVESLWRELQHGAEHLVTISAQAGARPEA
jgi:hypothetical protein